MRIITLLAAVIISDVLVGCGTVPMDPKLIIGRAPPPQTLFNSLSCSPNCIVKIEVNGDCKFDVPELVVLSGMAGKRHGVAWIIQSSDYVFSTTSGTPALAPKGSGGFFGTPIVAGPFMAVEVTVATPHLSHEYGLNIVKRSGTTVCPQVDPFVIE
jgi:hypothetical protein